jgi:hypothetical protein
LAASASTPAVTIQDFQLIFDLLKGGASRIGIAKIASIAVIESDHGHSRKHGTRGPVPPAAGFFRPKPEATLLTRRGFRLRAEGPVSIRARPVRIESRSRHGAGASRGRGTSMQHYLLSVYQPDGDPPPPAELDQIMARVFALQDEMKAAGVWVFSSGLHPPSTATVLRVKDGDVLTTDGPYVEGKEHLGGFTIIKAPDLDAALEWGRKSARATTLPIEVRPMNPHGKH